MSTNTKEIHLIASMIAVPGKESELREVLRGLIGPTRNEPGCRRYEMYESEQKGRYFADEIWQNREALDTHMQSAHFKIAAAAFPELLQGALGIDILSEIASCVVPLVGPNYSRSEGPPDLTALQHNVPPLRCIRRSDS